MRAATSSLPPGVPPARRRGALAGWAPLLALVWLFLLGCRPGRVEPPRRAAPSGEPVVVGVLLSLTGDQAIFGTSIGHGIRLAADEIEAAGGVLGRPVTLLVEDDHSDLADVEAATGRLLADERLVALIGGVLSSAARRVAPHTQAASVPLLLPISTAEGLTELGDRVFRVCFPDPYQGDVMARYATDSLGLSRAALLVDASSAYSESLAAAFEARFVARGGQIVARESYTFENRSFEPQLRRLRDQQPDLLYIPGYYLQVALIAQQARTLGLAVQLLGGDGWDSDDLLRVGGEAMVGALFSNHYASDAPSPRVQRFRAAYRARYGGDPDGLAALGYDAMMLLADAIARTGSTERDEVRDALAATQSFPGVTGDIAMDERRDARKPAVIVEVTAEGFRYKATVQPP